MCRQARRHGFATSTPVVGGAHTQMKIMLQTVKFKSLKPLKDTALIISCQSIGSSRPRRVLDGWMITGQADRKGGERETGEVLDS